MGNVKIIVDHDKIDYSGPVELTNLFRLISNFIWERGFDYRQEKDFEQNLPQGKFIEWQKAPWKWITDYHRYIIKIRILGYDLTRMDAMNDKKKIKIDNGRVLIVIDGFIEYDLQGFWEQGPPFLHFMRAMYDNFIYKAYTERFEQMLVNDLTHLRDHIEKFLNVYRHYAVISKKGT